MQPARTGTDDSRAPGSGRVKAFSDAVFAIIITLLVLDLRPPEHEPGQLWPALADRWPAYVAFVFSFLYIGALWLNHHAMFRNVARVDIRLNWLNLALLLGAVVIPFPTSVIASTFGANADDTDQRVAVLLYSSLAALMSLTWLGLWWYLSHHPELLADGADPNWPRAQFRRPIIGVALFGTGGLAGYVVSPLLGLAFIAAMLIYHAWTSEGVRR